MAMFSNAFEWDPNIVKAQEIDQRQLSLTSKFKVWFGFLGWSIVLHAAGGDFSSTDIVTVNAATQGTLVTYNASVRIRELPR